MAKIYRTNGDVENVEPKNGTDFRLEELSAIVGGYNDYIVGDVLICKTGEVK